MRHGVKKIKFNFGIDANKMLMRQLATNFFLNGKIKTTLKKAKMLKSYLEMLLEKTKVKNEANNNYLLGKLEKKALIDMLFNQIGPAVSKIKGGYIRVIKMGSRESDGSEVARIEWAYPVVVEKKQKVRKVEKVKNVQKDKNV